MARTDTFRQQHDEILQVVKDISARLSPTELAADATEVRSLLSVLAAKLTIHLKTEDRFLYPQLIGHKDENIRNLASKYMNEMGDIVHSFDAYLGRWPVADTIQKNTVEFAQDTARLFDVVGKRIEREDSELYALVDKAA